MVGVREFMALPDNKQDLYDLNLVELRDLFGVINTSYDRLRAKAITLLIGQVAIVTFLFSGGVARPRIIYGFVFYGLGILLLGLPFVIYLWIISPDTWDHPVDLDGSDVLSRKYVSKNDYTKHLVDEYIVVIGSNSKRLYKRSRPFVTATYLLSIGIFIMLLLKFGGGII